MTPRFSLAPRFILPSLYLRRGSTDRKATDMTRALTLLLVNDVNPADDAGNAPPPK
jgi:hypothetical protein